MLNFTSSLNERSEAFAIFVTDKFHYKVKNGVLKKETIKKIDSFIKILKEKNKDDEISSFDISSQKKCFIIKTKSKPETSFYEEIGGKFYTYLSNFKNINSIDFYADSLSEEKNILVKFITEFIFGYNLKSYKFKKYKTLNKKNIDKKINFKIISLYKK